MFLTRRYFDQRLDALILVLQRSFKQMAQSIQDLDAALDAFDQAQEQALAEIQAAVDDLVKKSGIDASAEIARLQAAQKKLTDAADAIRGQDTP